MIWEEYRKTFKNNRKTNGFSLVLVEVGNGLRSLLETLYFIMFFEGFPEPSENLSKTNGFSLVLGRGGPNRETL